jgi:hypothetical protein
VARLLLNPGKTRLIEFGRHAVADLKRRGIGRPETFAFLGFTFICGKSRRGAFQLQRKTRRDRMRAKLQEIKTELRQRMHQPIPSQIVQGACVMVLNSSIRLLPRVSNGEAPVGPMDEGCAARVTNRRPASSSVPT